MEIEPGWKRCERLGLSSRSLPWWPDGVEIRDRPPSRAGQLRGNVLFAGLSGDADAWLARVFCSEGG